MMSVTDLIETGTSTMQSPHSNYGKVHQGELLKTTIYSFFGNRQRDPMPFMTVVACSNQKAMWTPGKLGPRFQT